MQYKHKNIESYWQNYWKENEIYKVDIDKSKPKFYVLDMFPYPSGAGLHVGHPLGYIASDIYSRYKRLKGYNVLHPMGYDAFGLPAEQYAIQTGQHPALTTEKNIKRYREQLDKIGFSYDWSREIRTSDPDYYKWTQYVFIQLFKHYYNKDSDKAEKIDDLISEFEKNGNSKINAANSCEVEFNSNQWNNMLEYEKQKILLDYRLAYIANTEVNWCPKLGTVLANDEVVNAVSVRGGFPVERKKMKQWSLRISAYADRLLNDLNNLEWSDSLKEIQKNWIGKSIGAEILFPVKDSKIDLLIYTTRPDTIYGTTFMVLAPESEYTNQITKKEYKQDVAKYIKKAKNRSERERMTETKKVSGCFTGSYAVNPLNNKEIPIYVADYVLGDYGTGAIMAVPAHDNRDYDFAKHFNLDIIPVIKPLDGVIPDNESYDTKEGSIINSDIINGFNVSDAIDKIVDFLEKNELGKKKINYRLRDAIFSRQRYWGEPFPVYFKDDIPCVLKEEDLPLKLPEVDKYLPTEDGQPPLGRAKNWNTKEGYPYELSTMPGFAGSSAYYYRYMDPENNNALVSKEANEYWENVDLYIGGTEHATGHLIYSRFWNKFLFDIAYVVKDEPFKKLINQGMIQGRSNFVYRISGTNIFISKEYVNEDGDINIPEKEFIELTDKLGLNINHNKEDNNLCIDSIHVDINIVDNDILNVEKFRKISPEYQNAKFIYNNNDQYKCGYAIEKMSKSMYNVVNPDDIIEQYGADTLRMYEMFLGPIEQSKPWDTNGIEGVHKFFKKLIRLFYNDKGEYIVEDSDPSAKELKVLHETIKKVEDDIKQFSFNTAVSAFMICVNELSKLKCNNEKILKELIVLLSPFAPHIAEELWHKLGNKTTVVNSDFPQYNEKFLVEDNIEYPVSFNGKMRFKIELPKNIKKEEVEKIVTQHEKSHKWIDGKKIKKVIFVPGRIINIVV